MAKNRDIIEISNMEDLRKKSSQALQTEAIQLKKAESISVVELGKRLIVLKEQCLKHAEFIRFVKDTLNMQYSIANKYMRVVRAYGITEANTNVELVQSLGIKKAMRLIKIANLEERLAYIQEYDLINKSYQEIDNLLNELYPSQTKALNGYSLYTNIHRSLKADIKVLTDNKSVLNGTSKEIKAEAKEIQQQLNSLLDRLETFKAKLGDKTEDKPEQEQQQAK